MNNTDALNSLMPVNQYQYHQTHFAVVFGDTKPIFIDNWSK